MGIGLITLGFALLHLQFLNIQFFSIQMFPVSICLVIVILGYLYAYRDTKKTMWLYFSLFTFGIICFTFIMEGLYISEFRNLYLIFQTLIYSSTLLYIKRTTKDFKYQKPFSFFLFLYFLFGFLKAFGAFGWQIMYSYYYISSIVVGGCVSVLSVYLLMIRKNLKLEMSPQLVVKKPPLYVEIIMIIFAITAIIITRPSFIEYIYNQGNHLRIYQITGENYKIDNLIQMSKSFIKEQTNQDIIPISPEFIFYNGFEPKTVKLYINGTENALSGLFVYDTDGQHVLKNVAYQSFPSQKGEYPFKSLKFDDQNFSGVIQQKQFNEYIYEDQAIFIDKCLVYENRVYTLPRIQFKNKKIKMESVSLLDQNNQVLYTCYDYQDKDIYQDMITLYSEEILPSIVTGIPNKIQITYQDQDEIMIKDYEIKIHENYMSKSS